MITNLTTYLKEEIWLVRDNNLGQIQAITIKTLKIILLSLQGFKNDLCPLRASALSLYTLLSIVPVIALLFGIAKGFGFEEMLKQRLLEQSVEQNTMMLQLIEFSENMLANTQGGVVAGIGVVVLFWTVIKVIGNIEESFNQIWKIKSNRPLSRKISDYLSVMMLAPVLLIASSSITVFVKTQITWLIEVIHLPELGTKIVLYALSFSPWVIMALLFTFVFIFMPNRKISFKAGLIAGIVTGILYQWMQWVYLSLQLGVSGYNAIYGSFAALPLFLVWLQLIWFIVLLGCEISFYFQNYNSFCHNEKFSDLSLSLKKIIALQIMHLLVNGFARGEKAYIAEDISRRLHFPRPVVHRALTSLRNCNLIVELNAEEGRERPYQPAYDINVLSVSAVINALETSGRNQLPGATNSEPFSGLIQEQRNLIENSGCDPLLKDL